MLRRGHQGKLDIRKLQQGPCIVLIKDLALEMTAVPLYQSITSRMSVTDNAT